MTDLMTILRRFDLINLIAIGLVWWNLNAQANSKFLELNGHIAELDKRLTVIETVLLCNKMMPSHVAAVPD